MEEVTAASNKITPLKKGGRQPTQAYMLEVGIDRSASNKIIIGYQEHWKSAAFTSATPHDEFLKLVNGLIAKPTAGDKLKTYAGSCLRKPTKMSFRCNELIYLVFKLDKSIDWRFSVDGPPISMDGEWSGKDVFFAAKSAGELSDGKRYAYAVVDSSKGKPPHPDDIIEARFNLHVDFLEGGDTDPYTPVIIDPDVRYPGGNGGP